MHTWPTLTVAELLGNLLRRYELEKRPTIISFRTYFKVLNVAFGKRHPADITTDDLEYYKEVRVNLGYAYATVNRELAYLRRAYTIGTRTIRVHPEMHRPMALIDRAEVPFFDLFPEDTNIRKGFVDPVDFERIYLELPTPVNHIARFAYLTGWRKREVMDLRWSEIDLDGRMVRLHGSRTKTREGRVFPVTTQVLEILEKCDSTIGRSIDRVFVWHWGKPVKEFKASWKIAAKKAGVPELLFHDLRRSAVRNLVKSGVDRTICKKITGHRTDSVFERYQILDEAELVKAGQAIDQYCSDSDISNR